MPVEPGQVVIAEARSCAHQGNAFCINGGRAGPRRRCIARFTPCGGSAISLATCRTFVIVNGIYTFRANAMPLDLSRQKAMPDAVFTAGVRSQVQTRLPNELPA